jgi:hypothetical protein
MSVNRYLPHIHILPEDDANRQLATGFSLIAGSQIYVLPEARGWAHVRDDFASDHIDAMRQYRQRIMILLIDFDNNFPRRLHSMQKVIPGDLTERVFILGVRTEPEALKQAMNKSLEDIGTAMAEECRTKSYTVWSSHLLSHNANELSRICHAVDGWLFAP